MASFFREVLARGTINVEKIASLENPADVMTKSLLVSKFKHLQNPADACYDQEFTSVQV